uniref:Uncharacterized protein n=1 Tax=Vespula pensylvanica TaxID=30213 RepID=A0A834KCV4_VESPE|nr:hypothetical protein H0235_015130 [Vespula pensylvanica]
MKVEVAKEVATTTAVVTAEATSATAATAAAAVNESSWWVFRGFIVKRISQNSNVLFARKRQNICKRLMYSRYTKYRRKGISQMSHEWHIEFNTNSPGHFVSGIIKMGYQTICMATILEEGGALEKKGTDAISVHNTHFILLLPQGKESQE